MDSAELATRKALHHPNVLPLLGVMMAKSASRENLRSARCTVHRHDLADGRVCISFDIYSIPGCEAQQREYHHRFPGAPSIHTTPGTPVIQRGDTSVKSTEPDILCTSVTLLLRLLRIRTDGVNPVSLWDRGGTRVGALTVPGTSCASVVQI